MPSSSSSLLQRFVYILTVITTIVVTLISLEEMNTAALFRRSTAATFSNKFFVNVNAFIPTRASSASFRVVSSSSLLSSRFTTKTTTTTTTTTTRTMATKKPGIASLEELTKFVNDAGTNLIVIDVRNPDSSKEPGDQKSLAVASLPSSSEDDDNNIRPNALSLIWDRDTASMPLPSNDTVSKDAPIITHCGGGGRGQKAKDYLELNGYTNVLNGAGPKETELWKIYGDK